MAKRLYLHIGQTKTGSTALQAFLHANRKAIRQQGIHYPTVPEREPLKIQHRFLVHSLSASGDQPTRAEAVWGSFFRHVRDDEAPVAVVSEELFWHLFEQRPERRERALAWMAKSLRDFDVRIVCYLRRQDLWLESWFHQVARAPVHRPAAALSFDEFIHRQEQIGLLEYDAAISRWASAFGHDAIIVRPHDRDVLRNGDIIDDFCALIGLEVNASLARPGPVQRRIDTAACELSNLFARTPGAAPFRTSFLSALLDDDVNTSSEVRLMPPDRAQAILARYADGNAALASRYGMRPGLFAAVEAEEANVHGGISTQDLARLVIRLYVAQQREIEKLRAPTGTAPNDRPHHRGTAAIQSFASNPTEPTPQPIHPVMLAPSDRPRLILHIGTHKTGTSALQDAFTSQRALLRQHGILYPATARGPHPEQPKHSSVFAAAVDPDPASADRERAQLLAEFEANGARAMLLSEEGLCEPDERVSRFFEPLVGRFDIHVVCYLRRQDVFAESLFNQYVREMPRRDARRLAEFIRAPGMRRRMDYHALLARWASLPATIHALDFDRAARRGLAASFAAVLGCPNIGLPEFRSNPTPDMRLALLFNEMNRRKIDYDPHPLIRASALLGEAGLKPLKHVLGGEQRRQLLNDYATVNEQLAADFGVVFSSELPADEPPQMTQDADPGFMLQIIGALSPRHSSETQR